VTGALVKKVLPLVAVIIPLEAVIDVIAFPLPVVVTVVTVSVNLGVLPTATPLMVFAEILFVKVAFPVVDKVPTDKSSIETESPKVTGPVTVPPVKGRTSGVSAAINFL